MYINACSLGNRIDKDYLIQLPDHFRALQER